MPIHVTTSTTQSLSNKTFVDRVSTTGVVFASSGNSNQWSSTYSSVYATSASWDSTYTSLNTNSAKYDSAYTTVFTESGNWEQELSFDESNARLSISNGNFVSLSALSSSGGGGGGGITVETDPVFTTWAQANSGKYESTYTTVSATSGSYITNITSNTQGILSGIRLGNTFNVNTGLTVSATPTFDGLLVSNSVLTATAGVIINPAGLPNNNALIVNGASLLKGGAQVNNYILPESIGDEALPYSAIMKLNAYNYNASWVPDLGENVYNHVKSISGNLILGQLGITIDGAGSYITSGEKQYLRVPYNCIITSAEIVANESGNITIDIYKGTFDNFPTASSITGASQQPVLAGQRSSRNTSLNGWTTTLSAGEYLRFDVPATATVKKVTLTLSTRRQ